MAARVAAVLAPLLLQLLLARDAHADVYMHNPRGSNNRLNEASAARANANRVFDSQNNNRGGYNMGDATTAAASTSAPAGYAQQFSLVRNGPHPPLLFFYLFIYFLSH
jgi:hypothetical protein